MPQMTAERLAEIDALLSRWAAITPIPPSEVYPVAVQAARDLRAELTRSKARLAVAEAVCEAVRALTETRFWGEARDEALERLLARFRKWRAAREADEAKEKD